MSEFYTRFSETLKHAAPLQDGCQVGKMRQPILLPPIGDKFPGLAMPSLDGTAKVVLKSIRAPKFSVEYEVPLDDSVYSLKERLLTDPSRPLGDNMSDINATSIKLLLKSKVISDTRQLSELPSLSFTVMFRPTVEQLSVPLPAQIYWGHAATNPADGGSAVAGSGGSGFAAKASGVAESGAATSGTTGSPGPASKSFEMHAPPAKEYPGVTDQFWKEVAQVAKKYVANPEELVTTLRANYDTSMDLD